MSIVAWSSSSYSYCTGLSNSSRSEKSLSSSISTFRIGLFRWKILCNGQLRLELLLLLAEEANEGLDDWKREFWLDAMGLEGLVRKRILCRGPGCRVRCHSRFKKIVNTVKSLQAAVQKTNLPISESKCTFPRFQTAPTAKLPLIWISNCCFANSSVFARLCSLPASSRKHLSTQCKSAAPGAAPGCPPIPLTP